MPCAYVVDHPARAPSVETVREWFAPFDIVLAGRYGDWECADPDPAFIAGRRAAEQVLTGRAATGLETSAGAAKAKAKAKAG